MGQHEEFIEAARGMRQAEQRALPLGVQEIGLKLQHRAKEVATTGVITASLMGAPNMAAAHENTETIVVEPGDTFYKYAEERLPEGSTPDEILRFALSMAVANDVEIVERGDQQIPIIRPGDVLEIQALTTEPPVPQLQEIRPGDTMYAKVAAIIPEASDDEIVEVAVQVAEQNDKPITVSDDGSVHVEIQPGDMIDFSSVEEIEDVIEIAETGDTLYDLIEDQLPETATAAAVMEILPEVAEQSNIELTEDNGEIQADLQPGDVVDLSVLDEVVAPSQETTDIVEETPETPVLEQPLATEPPEIMVEEAAPAIASDETITEPTLEVAVPAITPEEVAAPEVIPEVVPVTEPEINLEQEAPLLSPEAQVVADLAQAILDGENISIAGSPNDRVRQSVQELANTGDTFLYDIDNLSDRVAIHPQLLQAILDSAQHSHIIINSLTTSHEHGENSYHYSGQAVDIAPADNAAVMQFLYDNRHVYGIDELIYGGELPSGVYTLDKGRAHEFSEATSRQHATYIHLAISDEFIGAKPIDEGEIEAALEYIDAITEDEPTTAADFNVENVHADGMTTDVQNALRHYLDKGMSPQGASCMIGNFMQESSMNPRAHNVGEDAWGFTQWRFERREGMPFGFYEQLDFALDEMIRHGDQDLYDLLFDSEAEFEALYDEIFDWVLWGHEGRRFEHCRNIYAQLTEVS